MAEEKIYKDISLNYTAGSVYYVERAYIGSKSINDYEVINTPYLLGKREEIIVSCNEFNENSQYRWTVPISSVHDNTDIRNKIIFENYKGEKKMARIDQLRCRHISDLYYNNGSYYKFSVKDDFLDIIISEIAKALPKQDPFLTQMNQYNMNNIINKVSSLEDKIKELEELIKTGETKDEKVEKRSYKVWTESEKERFIKVYRSSIDDAAEQFGMKRSSAISAYYRFNKERNELLTK